MGVELPKSFSSLSARILRGINEIKSSGCLTQSKWSCFEPLSSAKHMIIQRQIALIIGTISGFEHPLQGHTMLVEIIWKDEKKEIMGIEKITPCHSNYLLKKNQFPVTKWQQRGGGGVRCQPPSLGVGDIHSCSLWTLDCLPALCCAGCCVFWVRMLLELRRKAWLLSPASKSLQIAFWLMRVRNCYQPGGMEPFGSKRIWQNF